MNTYKTQDRPNPIWVIRGKKNNYFAGIYKTFMGRDALNAILKEALPKRVLIPSYTCNEVINEFEKRRCEIVYYDINPDFTINCDRIIEIIGNSKIDLFYYVVYFGLVSLNSNLSQAIKHHFPNIYIIEDRAHFLSNTIDFSYCDAIIFSFRKLLPIPEGGGYITRQNTTPHYTRRLLANIYPFLMYLKKMALGYNDRYNRTALTKNKQYKYIMPISWLSGNIIKRYDYTKETTFRKQCYNDWVFKLEKANIKPVFKIINDDDIPQGCPIYVENPGQLQRYMQSNNYYLRRHWKLRDGMSYNTPVACSVSNKIITLPIYRGVTGKIQNEIIDLLSKYNETV